MNISDVLHAAMCAPGGLVAALRRKPLVRFCVILFAALSVAVPVFTVSAVKISRGRAAEPVLPAPGGARLIEPDELFLPPEPDFLPAVLLRRAPRAEWRSADAAAHWIDPADAGGALWLDRVEASVDALLENVR